MKNAMEQLEKQKENLIKELMEISEMTKTVRKLKKHFEDVNVEWVPVTLERPCIVVHGRYIADNIICELLSRLEDTNE